MDLINLRNSPTTSTTTIISNNIEDPSVLINSGDNNLIGNTNYITEEISLNPPGPTANIIDYCTSEPYIASDTAIQFVSSPVVSIQEFVQFKSIISEGLRKLDQLIERFKSIVELSFINPPESDEDYTMDTSTTNDNSSSIKSATNNPLANNTSSRTLAIQSATTMTNNNSVEALRTVLTDIDQHLSILKEIEQRNSIICESFSKEIRSRDEALLEKMKQASAMNHELVSMQAKIQHLVMKNTQLENEIKYLKTTSLFNNLETSTPVDINDLERTHYMVTDQNPHSCHNRSIGSQQHQPLDQQQNDIIIGGGNHVIGNTIQTKLNDEISPQQLSSSLSTDTATNDNMTVTIKQQTAVSGLSGVVMPSRNKISIESLDTSLKFMNQNKENNQILQQQQAAIYHDLLVQYRKIEQLIQQNQVQKNSDYGDDSIIASPTYATIGDESSTMEIPTSSVHDHVASTNQQSGGTDNTELNNMNKTEIVSQKPDKYQQHQLDISEIKETQELECHQQQQKSSSPQSPISLNTPETLVDVHASSIKSTEDNIPQQKFVGDIQQQQLNPVGVIVDDNEDVVATSIKAYEHFVKMQHDLETLMKKENEYRVRIQKLEKENQELRQQVKEDEYNLSDVQYELDILKHNYDLEIESFSTAINERESLIEKLQQKMKSLKGRYMKLDERLKEAEKMKIELQTKIEELEGRLKYEELQKQTLIDSRLNELEIKLQDQEREYQLEISNLRIDLACSDSVKKDLQTKIDELETSLKNLASAEFEDEFIYYKNQIDGLVKELDKEKQERQHDQEQFEQIIHSKEKLLEHIKEQLRKEKDSMIREKTEYEQRYRKMLAKMKSKEQEIKELHEKLLMLNEKFKQNSDMKTETDFFENTSDQQHEGSIAQSDDGDRSKEQLLTELTLKDIKLNKMTSDLEDYEERFKHLEQSLEMERQRRRQLETFYLNSLNNSHNSNGYLNHSYSHYNYEYKPRQTFHQKSGRNIDLTNRMEFWKQDESKQILGSHLSTAYSSLHRRDSTSSLALLMDESSTSTMDRLMAIERMATGTMEDESELSYYIMIKRWLRRQKNNLLLGRTRTKLNRLLVLIYLILIHYLAGVYYINSVNIFGSFNGSDIQNENPTQTQNIILDNQINSSVQ